MGLYCWQWVSSYSLTFLLLAAEMVTFCAVVAPLPHGVRKRVFTFLSESPIVAKIAYGLKISFMCVVLPFKHVWTRVLTIMSLNDSTETDSSRSSLLMRYSGWSVLPLRRKQRKLAVGVWHTTCVPRLILLHVNSSKSYVFIWRRLLLMSDLIA